MDRISDIEAFIAIVERGNLSAAARHLDRSLQSISRSLMTLEKDIGVQLVRRTTHVSEPTDAGIHFYKRIRPAISEIADAKLETANNRVEPRGRLVVGAPVEFGQRYLLPLIAKFMTRYEQVEIDLQLTDHFADIAAEGLDLAIRIGDMRDSDLIAKRIGALRRVVAGAPSYFAKYGKPKHPRDLAAHNCIFRSTDRNAGTWQFREEGKIFSVRVKSRLTLNNAGASHAAIAEGIGIGQAPLWQMKDLVDEGKIEILLERFEQPPVPIQIVWPRTNFQPAKTRLFIDLIAHNLKF